MNLIDQALRGAASAAPAPLTRLQRLLIIGGGGTLGSALLAESLVAGRFQEVLALTQARLPSTLRSFRPVTPQMLAGGELPEVDLAVLVFERARHANGRDEAFVQPAPKELLPLAQALRRAGVQRLVVVLPHAPALMPQALKSGFATQDEADVAALDFQQLVFVRASQAAPARGGAAQGPWWRRLGDLWWAQMQWMVPAQEQPLRSAEMAQRLVPWLRQLPGDRTGTRVLTPDQLPPVSGAPAPDRPRW